MSIITKPYSDFVNNVDVADAVRVNAQINALYNLVNGNLDETNAPKLWGDNTTTKRPSISVYTTSALTLTSAGVWYKVPLNTKLKDNLTEFDIAAQKYTAKQAGTYHLFVGAAIASAANTRLLIAIYKNGSQVLEAAAGFTGITADLGATGGGQIELAVNDTVEMYVWASNGGSTLYNSNTLTYLHLTRIA